MNRSTVDYYVITYQNNNEHFKIEVSCFTIQNHSTVQLMESSILFIYIFVLLAASLTKIRRRGEKYNKTDVRLIPLK